MHYLTHKLLALLLLVPLLCIAEEPGEADIASKAMIIFTGAGAGAGAGVQHKDLHRQVKNYIYRHWIHNKTLAKIVFNIPFDKTETQTEIPLMIEVYGPAKALRKVVKQLEDDLKTRFMLHAYLVSENLPAQYQISWAINTPSPGMRLISMIYKKDALSKKQFANYWNNQHAKIATSYSIPVWNYSQNTITEVLTINSPPYDGIAALHFKHKDDLKNRWIKTPLEAARGPRDALNFMDMDNTRSQEMTELILKDSLR